MIRWHLTNLICWMFLQDCHDVIVIVWKCMPNLPKCTYGSDFGLVSFLLRTDFLVLALRHVHVISCIVPSYVGLAPSSTEIPSPGGKGSQFLMSDCLCFSFTSQLSALLTYLPASRVAWRFESSSLYRGCLYTKHGIDKFPTGWRSKYLIVSTPILFTSHLINLNCYCHFELNPNALLPHIHVLIEPLRKVFAVWLNKLKTL